MSERYRYAVPGRRSPPLHNPARATTDGTGYSPPLYTGELPAVAGTTTYYNVMTPRGQTADYRPPSSAGIPPSHASSSSHTSYAVVKDPLTRSSSVREHGSHARRSSLIEGGGRERPIIVTTLPSQSSGHVESPARQSHRPVEDEHYYSQPASSIHRRSRTSYAGIPSSAALDNDEYYRQRDRLGGDRHTARYEGGHRDRRPLSVYANIPPAGSSPSIDYDNGDIEYTNPGDMVRYDLDHPQPRHRRRESMDRYYRPTVDVPTSDVGRMYEGVRRGGPPPTTWGLDKLNQSIAGGIYDTPEIRMPMPPSLRDSGHHLDIPASSSSKRRNSSHQRPVSLYQESDRDRDQPSRHDDYYRSREDEHIQREVLRDREPSVQDAVSQRGFGLMVEGRPIVPPSPRRDADRDYDAPRRDADRDYDADRGDRDPDQGDLRREMRRERRRDKEYHSGSGRRRRSDEEVDEPAVIVKEDRRGSDGDDRRRKGDTPPPVPPKLRMDSEDKGSDKSDEGERKRVRDKVAAGLSLAAGAFGIGSAVKDREDKKSKSEKVENGVEKDEGRLKDPADDRRRRSPDLEIVEPERERRSSKPTKDAKDRRSPPHDEWEIVESPNEPRRRERSPRDEADARERDRRDDKRDDRRDERRDERRDPEARYAGVRPERTGDRPAERASEAQASSSSDENKPVRRFRRSRNSAAFNPSDTSDLMQLKAQLAATEASAPAVPAAIPTREKDRDAYRGPDEDRPSTRRSDAPPVKERSPDRLPDTPPRPSKLDAALMAAVAAETGALVRKGSDESNDSHDSRGRERDAALASREERQVRVVSPPREQEDKRPIKGILKQPKKWPEPENFVREGAAPHKDDKTKKDVPAGARWTKISRKLVNPEALTIGKERFEVRDEHVIILRVLSRDEIEAYTVATAQLRDMRRKEWEKSRGESRGDRDDRDDDEDRKDRERRRRSRKDKDDDSDERDPDKSRDKGRDRREKRDRDRDREEDRDREKERDRRERRERERNRELDIDRDRDRDSRDKERSDRDRRRYYDDDEDDRRRDEHRHHQHHSHRDRETVEA